LFVDSRRHPASRTDGPQETAIVSIDVTDATFNREVVERSRTTPVVVDLWAPWCGPCRTLGPILERVIDATGGGVVLTKVNVDENPQVSANFRVQGIPAVYALKDGTVVDGFVGAQSESVVQQFVDRLLPSERDLEITRLLEKGDEESLRQALELEPGHEGATIALAELLVTGGRSEEALEVLARIPESPESRTIAARARTGVEPSAADSVEAELDELLERVKDDDDARQRFVDLLEVLGADDPRTPEYRKKLTARLY
jgi:putative thioredoxin